RDVIAPGNPPVRISVIDVDPGVSHGTMVLLHGFGGQSAQWKAQIEFFAEDYHIVAPDLRGHGHSDKPHAEYTLDEMISDLDAVLLATQVPAKSVLFGHSFGGAVAATYAVRHPERVERLILIGTASRFELSTLLKIAQRVPTIPLQFIMDHFMRYVYAPAHA